MDSQSRVKNQPHSFHYSPSSSAVCVYGSERKKVQSKWKFVNTKWKRGLCEKSNSGSNSRKKKLNKQHKLNECRCSWSEIKKKVNFHVACTTFSSPLLKSNFLFYSVPVPIPSNLVRIAHHNVFSFTQPDRIPPSFEKHFSSLLSF